MPSDCKRMGETPKVQLEGSDPRRRYQVTLLGGARVGKSTIVSQFLYDKILTSYKPTVEELHRGEYEIEGETLILDLLDTSGTHQFPAMRELAIRQSDAFLLVYTIDDVASWELLSTFREEIVRLRGPRVPVVVAGNKSDLEGRRVVARATAQARVELDWDHGYMETCALQPHSVLALFKKVLHQGQIRYKLSPAVERRRKSLPTYIHKQKQEKFFFKRHSCNVS
ncbi:ras-related protein Rap-2b [Procambarus clarkii]|uniref:ras-related protein Rap-2b n=1 Tax=Procambarus clarkii TaxID=6728 RepID=UPI001E671F85|nr:ras-related protein Rap-2b-like [Procambarus clarkii]WQA41343.1 Ras-related protein Rab2B [Procambarus clarkii]